GRVTVEAAKYTGTGVDAFNCRFRVGVSERRERHLVNRFVTFPVDRTQNSVLSSNRHQRPLRSTDYRRVQRVGYGQVPVMLIVGNELPEPLQLSGSGVEHNHRGGIQILSNPHIAKEIRYGIADG